MSGTKYNGWTNWETWATNLHFDDCFNDDARAAWDDAEGNKTFTRAENAAFILEAAIKCAVEDHCEGDDTIKRNLFISEIISGFISTVNFHEIAKHYIVELEIEAA